MQSSQAFKRVVRFIKMLLAGIGYKVMVCRKCGAKYGFEPTKNLKILSWGKCDCCGTKDMVAHENDYGELKMDWIHHGSTR